MKGISVPERFLERRGTVYYGRSHAGWKPTIWAKGKKNVLLEEYLKKKEWEMRIPADFDDGVSPFIMLESIPIDQFDLPFIAGLFIPNDEEINEVMGIPVPQK
jgi:hypothetical protein